MNDFVRSPDNQARYDSVQPSCTSCWFDRFNGAPQRQNFDRHECCFCGESTVSGIYVDVRDWPDAWHLTLKAA